MAVLRNEVTDVALQKIYADPEALKEFKKQRRLGLDKVTVKLKSGEVISIIRSQSRLRKLAEERGLKPVLPRR